MFEWRYMNSDRTTLNPIVEVLNDHPAQECEKVTQHDAEGIVNDGVSDSIPVNIAVISRASSRHGSTQIQQVYSQYLQQRD